MITNFTGFVNESTVESLPPREMKYFSHLLTPELRDFKKYQYDPILIPLRQEEEKYNLIFDILDYMTLYNSKVGITKKIKMTNLQHLNTKGIYTLKVIHHKWEKLAVDPDIEPGKIYDDF